MKTASGQFAYDSSVIHRWAARDLCDNGKSADDRYVLQVAPIARPEDNGPTLSVFFSTAGNPVEVATLNDDFTLFWDCFEQDDGYSEDEFFEEFGLRMADLPELVEETLCY